MIQGIFSRPSVFDNSQSMMRVEDVVAVQPPLFWLNVEVSALLFLTTVFFLSLNHNSLSIQNNFDFFDDLSSTFFKINYDVSNHKSYYMSCFPS